MKEGLRGGKAEASGPGYKTCVRERGDRAQLDQSIKVRNLAKTSDFSGAPSPHLKSSRSSQCLTPSLALQKAL